jgi:drug/metabolite transporter (DMT)-like permease
MNLKEGEYMDNKPKAVLFMIISAFAFAVMGAMVKLSGDIPVFEKVFFRNLVSLSIAFIILYRNKESYFGKRENQKYLLGRSLLGLSGVIFYFYAISKLLLADSAMLNKLSPFFVTLFACLFLKEKLSKIQIPALIVVFIGAILVIKPQFSLEVLPAFSGMLSAVCAGAAYTLVRYLKNKEHPSTIVFYFSLISVLGMIPFMIFNFKVPTSCQLVYLIGTGVFAAIGQFSLTYGYKFAPASEVSIYNYLSILFSGVIGFFLWNEIPDVLSIFGGVLIILAAVVTFVYNNKK